MKGRVSGTLLPAESIGVNGQLMVPLLEAPAAQCRHHLSVMVRMMPDLDDSHLALEPRAGLKTAGWLLGHLAVTGDFGRRLLGRTDAMCPKDWRDRFNPGTTPSRRQEDYPAMRELRSAVLRVYGELPIAASEASEATLAGPNPYEPARNSFARVGDFAAYLLAGHFAYHVGQLSAWRAAAGLPVLGPE